MSSPGPSEQAHWGPRLQAGPTAVRPTYRLIQILRAIAALMVVAHHATIMLWQRDGVPVQNWLAGSSGVDIFFVISGFVMTVSSAPLRSVAHPARTFLARRLERIVPMYWVVTTAKVVVLLLVPAVALNGLGTWQHVLSSYLFVPWLSVEGRFEPVVVVGWTLNFEMAFYLLFAAALAWRWRPVWLLLPLLLLIPWTPFGWLLHVPVSFRFYISTVLWEFVFGMLLATVAERVRRWSWWVGAALVLAGFLPLLTWNAPGMNYWRGALWGVPALAVVAGAVAMEAWWGARSPRWALELGDASYSIYLIHTFVLPAVGLWLTRWPRGWPGEIAVALGMALLLSALSGELVYRLLELPMMRWFKGRRRTAVPVNA